MIDQERQALIEKLTTTLAERVGDDLCDDCAGSLVARDRDGNEVPCPDCTPREPEHVLVERALLVAALAALQSSPSREEREQALRLAEKAGAARAYVWPSPSAVAAVDMAEARHLLKLDPTPTEGT